MKQVYTCSSMKENFEKFSVFTTTDFKAKHFLFSSKSSLLSKYLLLFSFLIYFCSLSKAQTISTVAGMFNKAGNTGNGGAANAAELNNPYNIAFDGSGNMFIADIQNNCIRKVDKTTGIITVVAGTGTGGYNGDGPALSTQLLYPAAITCDASGNVWFADNGNNLIRELTTSGNIVSMIGDRNVPSYVSVNNYNFTGNNPYNIHHVSLSSVFGLAFNSSGILYFTDYDYNGIYYVSGSTVVPIIESGASPANSGDGGSVSAAKLYGPRGIAFDASGNVYVTTYNSVRKITTGGIITTVAGGVNNQVTVFGVPATTVQIGAPENLAFDQSGNMYISEKTTKIISKVDNNGIYSVYAGGSVYNTEGGLATSTQMYYPTGVVCDASGNIYVTDEGDSRVRKITPPCSISISSISPSSAGAGNTVTISGSGFTGATYVTFGGYPASSYTVVNDNTITAVVGNAGATGLVDVYNINCNSSYAGFKYNYVSNTINGSAPSAYVLKNSANGMGATPVVTSIATSGNNIYLGTYSGLSISTDGGKTFVTKTTANGLGSNSLSFVKVFGNVVYAASAANTLSISTDGGATFTSTTLINNPNILGFAANGVSTYVQDGITNIVGTVYVLTNYGLYISYDGGKTFPNIRDGNNSALPTNTLNSLFVKGSTLYVGTTIGLMISYDEGNNFSVLKTTSDGLGNNSVLDVYVVPNTDPTKDTIYAGTASGLSVSYNGGNTFTNKTVADGLGVSGYPSVNKVFVLGKTIYTLLSELFISTDGGSTYTMYSAGTVPGLVFSGSLTFNSIFAQGSAVYVGLYAGLAIGITKPDAPGTPTAVAGVGQATVSFSAPSYTGGPNVAISGYTVTSSPGGITATGGLSPLTITGLTNGIAYTFTVTATNAQGSSSASPASNSVTPYTVPGAPASVTAVRGNTQATISFAAPASDGWSAITGYTVKSNPGNYTVSGSASPLTVTGLSNGTAYTFTVTATNAAGTGPASAASNSVTPASLPGQLNTNQFYVAPGDGQACVYIYAQPSNGGYTITGFTITAQPGNISITKPWGTPNPVCVTGLTNGTAYTFTIAFTNAVGTGPASLPSASVTPLGTPVPPTNVAAVAGNGKATVSFTAPANNTGGAVSYVVVGNAGGYATGNTSPITVTGLTNGTQYTFIVETVTDIANSIASSTSNAVTPGYIWTGTGTSDYFDNNSWIDNLAPASSENDLVIIPSGTPKIPALSNDAVINNLELDGSLDISGHQLTLNNLSGTGFLKGTSGSSLVCNGSNTTLYFDPAANTLQNLISDGNSLSLGNALNITGILTVNNGVGGVFNTNNNLTLKSTSINNTAVIAPVNGTITGNVTVERYIPKGYKAFRELSTGGVYNAGTIFNNWQEGGNRPAGFGTFVTGAACPACTANGFDAGTGLDKTVNGYSGLYNYTYNNWAPVTNTMSTNLDAFTGYHLLIYGDRTSNLYGAGFDANPMMNAATVIRTTGSVVTGDVTYTSTGVTNSNGITSANNVKLIDIVGEGSFVANPYPCAIDWTTLTGNNLEQTYYYFDPTYLTGGYQEFVGFNTSTNSNSNPLVSAVNQYIQPGQSFWVQADNTAGAGTIELDFHESNKVTSNFGAPVFKGAKPNRIIATIWKKDTANNLRNIDGAVAVFGAAFNKTVGKEDSKKFWNSMENITILENSTDLCIDGLPLPKANDSIYLNLNNFTANKAYTLRLDIEDYTAVNRMQPYLFDRFSNTVSLLGSDSTFISFTTTADKATYSNRYVIVFKPSGTLPVKFISVKAAHTNSGNLVSWQTGDEGAMADYTVEKSVNGTDFAPINTIAAKNVNNSSYSCTDVNADAAVLYYRIKGTGNDGSVSYSNIVTLNNSNSKSGIVAIPNPVVNGMLNLQLNNIPKGNYYLVMYNTAGQEMMRKNISSDGNTFIQKMELGSIAAGIYTIKLLGTEYTTQLIINN